MFSNCIGERRYMAPWRSHFFVINGTLGGLHLDLTKKRSEWRYTNVLPHQFSGMPLQSILPWSQCSTLEKKHPSDTNKQTHTWRNWLHSESTVPNLSIQIFSSWLQRCRRCQTMRSCKPSNKQHKEETKFIFYLLPICQMLFTGWRLNPREANTNMFLLSKNTVNWKDGRPCLHFQHRIAKEPRHRGIFGDFRIRRVQQYDQQQYKNDPAYDKVLCMNIIESLCFAFLLCHIKANTIANDE